MELCSVSILTLLMIVSLISPCLPVKLHVPLCIGGLPSGNTTSAACKAEMRRLTEKLTFHTVTYGAEDVSIMRTYTIFALPLAVLMLSICWRSSLMKSARIYAEQLELLQQQAEQHLQELQRQHLRELEDARNSLKRARAETRMITRHHADKILLPDPSPYQKKYSALLYAAKHYGFEDGENMVNNLLHTMYKLVKLEVLYQYIFEVLQLLPAPSIEADEDDLILQRDDGPSPSRATEESMWGKVCQLDDDLDAAIQRYLDTIAEPSILNSLEPKWSRAAADRFHELVLSSV